MTLSLLIRVSRQRNQVAESLQRLKRLTLMFLRKTGNKDVDHSTQSCGRTLVIALLIGNPPWKRWGMARIVMDLTVLPAHPRVYRRTAWTMHLPSQPKLLRILRTVVRRAGALYRRVRIPGSSDWCVCEVSANKVIALRNRCFHLMLQQAIHWLLHALF